MAWWGRVAVEMSRAFPKRAGLVIRIPCMLMSVVAVIESDATSRAALCGLLRACGYQPTEWSGHAGRNDGRSNASGYDAIIAVQRPFEENVVALAVDLRAHAGGAVPVLILASSVDRQVRREAQGQGISILEKPLDPERLLSWLSKAVLPSGCAPYDLVTATSSAG